MHEFALHRVQVEHDVGRFNTIPRLAGFVASD